MITEGLTIDEMRLKERHEQFCEERQPVPSPQVPRYVYTFTVRHRKELGEIISRCGCPMMDCRQTTEGIHVRLYAEEDMFLTLCQAMTFLPHGKEIMETMQESEELIEVDEEDRAHHASPAPWTVQTIPRERTCGTSYVAYAIRDRRNCCVAMVGEVDAITDGGEGGANARLMRAAPELAAYLLRLKMDRSLATDATFWDQVDRLFARIEVGIEVKGLS